jgi:hypothetical protein
MKFDNESGSVTAIVFIFTVGLVCILFYMYGIVYPTENAFTTAVVGMSSTTQISSGHAASLAFGNMIVNISGIIGVVLLVFAGIYAGYQEKTGVV